MENIEQENLLEGETVTEQAQPEEQPQAVQLVQPKEAEDEIARLEKQYRETIKRENNGSI